MNLHYNNVTLTAQHIQRLKVYAEQLKVPVSFLITQLHVESLWGMSDVAKVDRNWVGMTWTGESFRSSGVTVTKGSPRPASEGGFYIRYSNIEDGWKDWIYLLSRSGIYNVQHASTFTEAVKSLFQYGGAKYDYATMNRSTSKERYEAYLNLMLTRRQAINEANHHQLDQLDGLTHDATLTRLLSHLQQAVGVIKGSLRHKQWVDQYNKTQPLPQGYRVTYEDDWCDLFVTVMADQLGLSHLTKRECGVERHKQLLKQAGCYIGRKRPQPGDLIFFHWGGDPDGFAHHIGFVERVHGDQITTIEGNTIIKGLSQVGRKTYRWNASVIQGYARWLPRETQLATLHHHLTVTIPHLRVFKTPHADLSQLYETLKQGDQRNIRQRYDDGEYIWVGYDPNPNGIIYWTTLQTSDGTSTFGRLTPGDKSPSCQ